MFYCHTDVSHFEIQQLPTNSSSRGVMATRLTSNQKIMGSTPIVSAFFE